MPIAICEGMTSAIMNPVRQQEMEAIRAANFLMNHDANGGEWIRFAKVIDAVESAIAQTQSELEQGSATAQRRPSSPAVPGAELTVAALPRRLCRVLAGRPWATTPVD